MLQPAQRAAFAIAAALVLAFEAPQAQAAAAVAADGEATVYVRGDFSGNFDLEYRTALEPAPRNRSWSSIGIMLLGEVNPGPSVYVGLANEAGGGRAAGAFTSAALSSGKNVYHSLDADCAGGCLLALHGTPETIEARVNGRVYERWRRASFPLKHPYVQLDAEVNAEGDSIAATLTPVRTTAEYRQLAPPGCAFTTRGILVHGGRTLSFSGTYRSGAPVSYILLTKGAWIGSCANA